MMRKYALQDNTQLLDRPPNSSYSFLCLKKLKMYVNLVKYYG